MLRIGIDVTALPPQPFGAANYIINLAQALLRIDTTNEYVIFTKPAHAALFDSSCAQIIQSALPSLFLRLVWEQTVLPILVRRHQLDVLHSPHYTMPIAKPCRSVVTIHDLTFFLYPEMHLFHKRLFFRTMMRVATRHADALIAISHSTRADMLRILRASPDKIQVIHYGVGSHFRPINDSGILDAFCHRYRLPRPFIVYVGNFEPRKNLPTLVRAFAHLVRDGMPHALVLTGTRGWKDKPIFTAVKELDLFAQVHFPGYIPQSELPMLYNAADLFVYPSLYEGFGLPVLEAMACGVPVVTSDIASMPEVTGDAAILIPPQDTDALADAMKSILTDSARRATLSAKGLARAREFSWERTAQSTLSVYTRVAQTR